MDFLTLSIIFAIVFLGLIAIPTIIWIRKHEHNKKQLRKYLEEKVDDKIQELKRLKDEVDQKDEELQYRMNLLISHLQKEGFGITFQGVESFDTKYEMLTGHKREIES